VIICGNEIKISGRIMRVARLDADKYQFLSNPETTLQALRSSGQRIDLFTFLQGLPEITPKFGYPMEWDNLAVLPISTFEKWWTEQVDAKTRNMVRKAEKKGVVLREVRFSDELVRGIWEIYNETPVRQGRPFQHYGKDLQTVHREEATYLDSSVFIGAFLGEKLIGFIKMVSDKAGIQTGLMNIVSLIQERDKAPTNALLAQAVRECALKGVPYLVYSNFSYGKRQRDSLSDFKKNNGFQRFDIPRYYIPLTITGRVAFQLGLHHKLADHVPESWAEKLRALRDSWYKRKTQPLTESS
jgi:hypothetical protein